ncbi:hypothetical protein K2F40_07215 [Clostridium sp. CM028]|uniref:hypothetical protein n=1 Tax=Clostridium sp. CM028 TaxID=2851575 RepID=UPI001C6F08F3|nr:hypothetical protein [Clostridium sp. CM028]MBW9148747.1 hypothetical protein [Clostridium sp. CM028]WLC63146.1 hypothetical protein KTC94_07850 [Clostridium sp. CM028]
MEYTKGRNIISKLFKSVLSIGTFIVLLITLPYIAIFVIKALFAILVFGALVWYSFKLIKGTKNFIYKLSAKKNFAAKADMFSSDKDTSDSIDINYDDSVIVDVDYEEIL